ncbi:Protein TolB [bacterium HR40]|nr:Protein TolB [bacterium HR40]
MKRLLVTRRWVLASGAASAVAFVGPGARGQLRVDITRGLVEPIPIAVSPFAGDMPATADLGRSIADVAAADLERSGLFRRIDPRAYIQSPDELRGVPRFADWRQIDAQALVAGTVATAGSDRLVVEFRLFDVFAGTQMTGYRYELARDLWRRVAHRIADTVYERLTGEKGYFDTRIAYIAESGPPTARVKRLAVMDQDGANHRFLTDGRHLVLTPRFSPDGSRLAFLAYRGGTPGIFLHDFATGRQERLAAFEGMNFSPRFSPDGRSLLLTIAQGGNSDIFEYDLATRRLLRLTAHPAIDTSPSYSPDGARIVFNSDRGGRPHLYVMRRDGSDVQRISYGEGRYGSPVWSPRGDLVAFTNIKERQFHIGVMRPDGSGERLITRSYFDDGPVFAPNGRVILFAREDPATDARRLMTIDVTGYNLRELPTPLDASDPDWSPLLP